MVTLAAIFPPTQAPERLGAVAAAADSAGLEQLWIWEDCFAESGIATAAAILAATRRVTVGIGATHVAVNAAEDDADLKRFAGFLAREVSPLVR